MKEQVCPDESVTLSLMLTSFLHRHLKLQPKAHQLSTHLPQPEVDGLSSEKGKSDVAAGGSFLRSTWTEE